MSAIDTFEWFVTTQLPVADPGIGDFITGQRQYLYTIRSEDERQRFVEWAMSEMRRMVKAGEGGRQPAK